MGRAAAKCLSERVSRVSNLLRTRVEIEQQQSSQQLLGSMNERQAMQLKLQSTVEGLSVAAITYYITGLISYLAKGRTAWAGRCRPRVRRRWPFRWWPSVWWGLRRLHHRRLANTINKEANNQGFSARRASMDLGIAGKWALVCAASKGLGFGCAQALVAEGVNVVINARTEAALQEAAEKLRATGADWARASGQKPPQVLAVACDITTPEGRAAVLSVPGGPGEVSTLW